LVAVFFWYFCNHGFCVLLHTGEVCAQSLDATGSVDGIDRGGKCYSNTTMHTWHAFVLPGVHVKKFHTNSHFRPPQPHCSASYPPLSCQGAKRITGAPWREQVWYTIQQLKKAVPYQHVSEIIWVVYGRNRPCAVPPSIACLLHMEIVVLQPCVEACCIS
jgi:hypothetical protein